MNQCNMNEYITLIHSYHMNESITLIHSYHIDNCAPDIDSCWSNPCDIHDIGQCNMNESITLIHSDYMNEYITLIHSCCIDKCSWISHGFDQHEAISGGQLSIWYEWINVTDSFIWYVHEYHTHSWINVVFRLYWSQLWIMNTTLQQSLEMLPFSEYRLFYRALFQKRPTI